MVCMMPRRKAFVGWEEACMPSESVALWQVCKVSNRVFGKDLNKLPSFCASLFIPLEVAGYDFENGVEFVGKGLSGEKIRKVFGFLWKISFRLFIFSGEIRTYSLRTSLRNFPTALLRSQQRCMVCIIDGTQHRRDRCARLSKQLLWLI